MNVNELKIEYIDISQLNPYQNNSKLHTKSQIKHIANSIEQFGFNDPIGVAGDDNLIIEGHGRVEALKLLGIARVPCIRLDHLNEKERKAYIIAHNSLNMETGFDEAILISELKALQDTFDFKSLGIEAEKYLRDLDRIDLSDNVKQSYEVIVTCSNEQEQELFYNKLISEGYKCKLST